jgi:CubicO group peptidase (beta-lactamase class C family)
MMNALQERVQETIEWLVASGAERGLQVAVYLRGELVVDAVTGIADATTGRLVAPDTLFYAASTGKGVAATAVHVLAERGVLNYDTRIAALWPEFGVHGKGHTTVRHALTHAIGVPGLPADTTPEDLCDWERICATIAAAAPWWEPGTTIGYHPLTWGYIVGEIVRGASGKPIAEVLREEVAGPLGIADELFFGVPAAALGRVARQEDAPGMAAALAAMPDDAPIFAVVPRGVQPTAAFGNRADILSADIPATGTMTARAVARMYAALLGEVGGVRLVSPERLRAIAAVAMRGVDAVMGVPSTFGLGYGIGFIDPLDRPTVFGMAGSGGTAAYADTKRGLTIALMKNTVAHGDYTSFTQVAEAALGALPAR